MLLIILVYGCATTAPQPAIEETLQGIASWYGEEFAGKTTANGEIFDPMQLTAAHRTLPFGTVLDVTNLALNRTVRVRINDRGPYVGNRVLDLSYAAAKEIGLVDPGSGTVAMKVVRIGKGEREPPAPYVVEIPDPGEKVVIEPEEVPAVAFPLPTETAGGTTSATTSDTFSVQVQEEHAGVATRRQVASDGKSIEEVPLEEVPAVAVAIPVPATVPEPSPAPKPEPVPRQRAKASPAHQFIVQVGAFAQESNAKALQQRLARIGQEAFIDQERLYRVRIGPFDTRDLAVKKRTELEANGLSAIILAE